jgi:hypothetical protein
VPAGVWFRQVLQLASYRFVMVLVLDRFGGGLNPAIGECSLVDDVFEVLNGRQNVRQSVV